jgi:hypothetical protein
MPLRRPRGAKVATKVPSAGVTSQSGMAIMFVSEDVLVPVGYPVVLARLASILQGSGLRRSAQDAYHDGLVTVLRVGPAPMLSRLVSVEFRDLVTHGDSSLLTLRWETAGGGGGLFPVLDADITITPVDDERTRLRLDGSYRPPLGAVGASLDRAVMHRVAAATIRSFVTDMSAALARPAEERTPAREHESLGFQPDVDAT